MFKLHTLFIRNKKPCKINIYKAFLYMQLRGLEPLPTLSGLEPEFCEGSITDYIELEKVLFCGIFEGWILLFWNISIGFYRRCIPIAFQARLFPIANNLLKH